MKHSSCVIFDKLYIFGGSNTEDEDAYCVDFNDVYEYNFERSYLMKEIYKKMKSEHFVDILIINSQIP